MQVPTIRLSETSQATAKKIIEASKGKLSSGQQMQMASYFAFLHSEKTASNDVKYFARTLLG